MFSFLDELEKTDDLHKQSQLKKEIKQKVEKYISEVMKYQNQQNTIDKCILAVPPAITENFPELMEYARKKNVLLTPYGFVYLTAYLLYEEYKRHICEGDIGEYKKSLQILMQLIEEVQKKAETIDRGLKIIENAKDEIIDRTIQAKQISSTSRQIKK